MQLNIDLDGNWLIDPVELAARLHVAPSYLQRHMKLGLVTSRIEAGSGDDQGRTRVTVRLPKSAWQGIFSRIAVGSDESEGPTHGTAHKPKNAWQGTFGRDGALISEQAW